MGVGGEWGSGGVKSRVGQRVNKASAISEQSVLPSFFFLLLFGLFGYAGIQRCEVT